MSWADRARWELRAIWLASGLIGVAIAFLVASVPVAQDARLDAADAVSGIENKLGLFGFVLDLPVISRLASEFPQLMVAAFGFFVIGGLIGVSRRKWLHSTFVVSFNHDALVPVADTHRPDREQGSPEFVELPWTLGEAGPRREVWDRLGLWARDGAFERAGWFGRFGSPKEPLSVQILAGRAGSGKSRIAYEFARHLARRDVLGGDAPKASVAWRLAAWLRRVVLPLRMAPGDPWDAGMVIGNGDRLVGWTPRRPTVLVLDDPGVGDAATVWQRLNEARNGFRHPVRLLVANQTVPKGLGLAWGEVEGETDKGWVRDKGLARHPPIVLPQDAWFTEAETIGLGIDQARKSVRSAERSIAVEREIRSRLYSVTRGNPLLVQLALEWLRDKGNLDDMTVEALSAARAARILTALEINSLDDPVTIRGLALSSLLGGVPAARLREHAGIDLPSLPTLAMCFPADVLALGANGLAPAVRPELVADAFVERFLDRYISTSPQDLVRTGFQLDAARMLRAVRRRRPASSKLAEGIEAFTKLSNNDRSQLVDPVEWALALVDVAVICQPDDRPLTTEEDRRSNLEAAVSAIEALSAEQAADLVARLAQLLLVPEPERAYRQVRPGYALHVAAATAKVANGGGSWDAWKELLDHLAFKEADQDGLPPMDAAGFVEFARRLDRHPEERLAFARGLWDLGQELRGFWVDVWRSLTGDKSEGDWALEDFLFLSMASHLDPERVTALTKAAKVLAGDECDATAASLLAEILWHECYAWTLVPAGQGAKKAKMLADELMKAAAKSSDVLAIQRSAAGARNIEAYGWSRVPLGGGAQQAQTAANSAVRLAESHPDDDTIRRSAAGARAFEALAWSQVPLGGAGAEAKRAADRVAEVAATFENDVPTQGIAASARCHEAFAWNQVPQGAEASASCVAADAADDIAKRFPNEVGIQCLAATARRYEAFAWAEVPFGDESDNVRMAADEVAETAARFPDSAELQLELAYARSYDVWSSSAIPGGVQAQRARSAADDLAEVAARFSSHADIQKAYAIARRHEAHAWSQVLAGAQADRAREAADAVAEVAGRFPDDAHLQVDMARARTFEAEAWGRRPQGRDLHRVRSAVRVVEAVAARFPTEPQMSDIVDLARSHLIACEAEAEKTSG